MKKYVSALVFLFFLFPAISPKADELEEYILTQVLADKFPTHLYDQWYRAYVVVDDGSGDVMVYDRDEIEELVNLGAEATTDKSVERIRILSRSDTDYFTSATYEYEWSAKIGNTEMTGTISGHTVLMNTDDGWLTVFDASIQ